MIHNILLAQEEKMQGKGSADKACWDYSWSVNIILFIMGIPLTIYRDLFVYMPRVRNTGYISVRKNGQEGELSISWMGETQMLS